jgi:hypothetical protein
MSVPGTVPGDGGADPVKDLEVASRTFHMVRTKRTAGSPPSLIEFASSLNFLLTIGYLTKEQADALVAWFTSSGLMKLPDLPGPTTTAAGTTMYEILGTAIHFGTPQDVRELIASGGDLQTADIGDFFSALAAGVGDLFTTVTDGVVSVLDAGTALLQAGTEFIHALHDDIVMAP